MLTTPRRFTLFPYSTLFRSSLRVATRSPSPWPGPRRSLGPPAHRRGPGHGDRKSTRLNSSHRCIPYAVLCLLTTTMDEWLLAAEYIMAEGNYNVILCERGIR